MEEGCGLWLRFVMSLCRRLVVLMWVMILDSTYFKGNGMENDQMVDVEHGNPWFSSQNNVPQAGLVERNSTSSTCERNDPVCMSTAPTNGSSRYPLPAPERNAFTRMKNYEDGRPKRRRLKRWSSQEVDTLKTGVDKNCTGRWKLILEANRDVFDDRTEVYLMDKWRNLINSRVVAGR